MGSIKSYKNLDVWKVSSTLIQEIYKLCEFLPKYEDRIWGDQMRRAALSVNNNIAEGTARNTRKDFKRFITTAFASATELENLLINLKQLPFAKAIAFENVESLTTRVLQMLNKLWRAL